MMRTHLFAGAALSLLASVALAANADAGGGGSGAPADLDLELSSEAPAGPALAEASPDVTAQADAASGAEEAQLTTTELDPPPVEKKATGGKKPKSDPKPAPEAHLEATTGSPNGDGHVGGAIAAAEAHPATGETARRAEEARRDQLAEGIRNFLVSMRRSASAEECAMQLRERKDDVLAAAEASEFLKVVDDSITLAV